MMSKAEKKRGAVLAIHRPEDLSGKDKLIGGSMSDRWNVTVANQVINTLWTKHLANDGANKLRAAAVEALVGIKPNDEIEGMIAAQLIACHNASMECYRRAMLPDVPSDQRHGNLNSANKLSRTYSTLVESLNRHRGKGQQKMTVEHVHVHSGGQAIVGNVESRGGGVAPRSKEQPHALGYAPGTTMPSADTTGEPVSGTGDEERSMPDARGNVPGRTEGK
jgi:hypothetical protein